MFVGLALLGALVQLILVRKWLEAESEKAVYEAGGKSLFM